MRPEADSASRRVPERFIGVGAGRQGIRNQRTLATGGAGRSPTPLLDPQRIVALALTALLGLGFVFSQGGPLPRIPKRLPSTDARLIPDEDVMRVLDSGRLAGLAQACGLNWTKFYLSFMRAERSKQWNGFQFATISGLFAYHQERTAASFDDCTAHRRTVIQLEVGRRMSDQRL